MLEDLIQVTKSANGNVGPVDIRIGRLVFGLHIENQVKGVFRALHHNSVSLGWPGFRRTTEYNQRQVCLVARRFATARAVAL